MTASTAPATSFRCGWGTHWTCRGRVISLSGDRPCGCPCHEQAGEVQAAA
jgi:hypothetical protein